MINAAVANVGLYSSDHPQVIRYIQNVYESLTGLLADRPEINLLIIGKDIVVENRPVVAGGSSGAYLEHFSRILGEKGVERLTFIAGMPVEDLQALINDLAAGPETPVKTRPSIRIGKVEVRVKVAGKPRGGEPQAAGEVDPLVAAAAASIPADLLEELNQLSAKEMDELKELYSRMKNHKKISVRGIEDIVKNFIGCFRREINPLGILASIKSAHEYTFTHVANVGVLTMSQAERMGFTGEHLHNIGVASLLHDVGKLFIPEEILGKPGMLTPDERKIMETHSVKGARYLIGLEGIPKLAVLAALEHHIKFDGTGYPSVRGGWKPNIISQIISVADVFDAMRSKRAYQEAHPLEKIEGVLRGGSGKAFNPLLVNHFLKMIK
ncbi:MAG: HD domain-containing protein [Nitrospirota bacterium]|nr:HD domain-containing protein [Nitrospirota bacterium]